MGNNRNCQSTANYHTNWLAGLQVHFFALLVSVILGKEEGKDEVQVFNTALREILDYLT